MEDKKAKKEELFDDCPICQVTKFTQEHGRMPTLSGLRKAFKKTKGEGTIVGGQWFEKD